MLKLVTCIKQVPNVSELPWDKKTGTLKRDLADGMMNSACRNALEASLILKSTVGAEITVITMGPAMAEEILREALALGADRGILINDRKFAGADTLATSYTLARAIEKECPNFDLILCGCHTNDSETAQIGPQLTEELNIPGVTYINRIEITGRKAVMERLSDDFVETLEMELPGLITVTTQSFPPRYVPLAGLQDAFNEQNIIIRNAEDLDLDEEMTGIKGSPTKIQKVYSPTADKDNIVLKGSARKIVDDLFKTFEDRIGGAIGEDIKKD